MRFYIEAVGSGKTIRVIDKIGGSEAFNDFVDLDEVRDVTVASNDGQTGNIDLYKRLTASNPEYIHLEDYDVRRNETVRVDDP